MARSGDGNSYTSATATNSPNFTLMGGLYMVSAVGTFGGGSIELQYLGPDGATFLSLPTALKLTAAGTISGNVPAGTYRWTVTTITNFNVNARRVPND